MNRWMHRHKGMWYCIVPPEETARLGLELVPSRGRDICRLGEVIKVACREQHPVQHPSLDYPGVDIMVFRGPPGHAEGEEGQGESGNSSRSSRSSSSSSSSSSSKSGSSDGGSSDGDGADEEDGPVRAHARNAVVMSNGALRWDDEATWGGMIDRSPCGTGTCAVMASLWARGELGLDEDFVHESILGTTFRGRLLKETTVEEKGGSGSSGSGSGSGSRAAVVPKIAGRAWITQICAVVRDPSDPFPEGYTVGDIWAA